MSKNWKPLGDRVLVKKYVEGQKKTPGGIFIPKSSKDDNYLIGQVVSVGSGKNFSGGSDVPMEVKEGEFVAFSSFAGTKMEDNMIIIRMSDVLGKKDKL